MCSDSIAPAIDSASFRNSCAVNGISSFPPIRQSEGHISISAFGANFATAAGDDDKLAAVDGIGRRGRVAGRRQLGFPQFLARLTVERSHVFIATRADEYQSARGNDRAAIIF